MLFLFSSSLSLLKITVYIVLDYKISDAAGNDEILLTEQDQVEEEGEEVEEVASPPTAAPKKRLFVATVMQTELCMHSSSSWMRG